MKRNNSMKTNIDTKAQTEYVKFDSRKRVALGKFKILSPIYKAIQIGDNILLEPIIEKNSDDIHWLLLPENKELLNELKECAKETKTVSLESVRKRLKI